MEGIKNHFDQLKAKKEQELEDESYVSKFYPQDSEQINYVTYKFE